MCLTGADVISAESLRNMLAVTYHSHLDGHRAITEHNQGSREVGVEMGVGVAGPQWSALLSDNVCEQAILQEVRSIHTTESKFNTSGPSSQAFLLYPFFELISGVIVIWSGVLRHGECYVMWEGNEGEGRGGENQHMQCWFEIYLIDISCCSKFGTTNIIGVRCQNTSAAGTSVTK
jgi:hypothetical protein